MVVRPVLNVWWRLGVQAEIDHSRGISSLGQSRHVNGEEVECSAARSNYSRVSVAITYARWMDVEDVEMD
jgi:hypothetical protein